MDVNMTPKQRNEILAKVKEGMNVIDVDGDKVGKVEFVRMAREGVPLEEPRSEGRRDPIMDFATAMTGAEGEIIEPMLQFGFVQVDAVGWFTGRRYIPPEQIGTVDATTVRLNVDKGDTYKP